MNCRNASYKVSVVATYIIKFPLMLLYTANCHSTHCQLCNIYSIKALRVQYMVECSKLVMIISHLAIRNIYSIPKDENTVIGTLKASNIGHIITDPAKKTNILNKNFESVFTVEHRELSQIKVFLCFHLFQ